LPVDGNLSQRRQPVEEQIFLSVRECAELLRLQPRTIYELIEKKLIPVCPRPLGTGRIRFEREKVIAWAKGGEQDAHT